MAGLDPAMVFYRGKTPGMQAKGLAAFRRFAKRCLSPFFTKMPGVLPRLRFFP
jgi:hypothetical protein